LSQDLGKQDVKSIQEEKWLSEIPNYFSDKKRKNVTVKDREKITGFMRRAWRFHIKDPRYMVGGNEGGEK